MELSAYDNLHSIQIGYLSHRRRILPSVIYSRSYWDAETGNLHGSEHVMARAKICVNFRQSQEATSKCFQVSQTKRFRNSRISNCIFEAPL